MGSFCLRSWSPVGPGRRWLFFTLQPRGPVLGGGILQELKIPRAPGLGLVQHTHWSQTPAPTASLWAVCPRLVGNLSAAAPFSATQRGGW